MTIESKTLLNMVKKVDASRSNPGIYIEGYDGGVRLYSTDGAAVFRQTIEGENEAVFLSYYSDAEVKKIFGKAGANCVSGFAGKKCSDLMLERFDKLKLLFEETGYNAFTVAGSELRKAYKAVHIVNKGITGGKPFTVMSARDGRLDIASWNKEGESAVWSLDTTVELSGAFTVTKKYLDGLPAVKKIDFSYFYIDGKLAVRIDTAGMEVLIMPLVDDLSMFQETLGYEYAAPEKPQVLQEAEKSNNEKRIEDQEAVFKRYHEAETGKKAAKRPNKPEPDTTESKKARPKRESRSKKWQGWTWNAKKMMWTKLCNW